MAGGLSSVIPLLYGGFLWVVPPWCGATVTEAEEYPVLESFDEYDLKESWLRGIHSYGFEKPSA